MIRATRWVLAILCIGLLAVAPGCGDDDGGGGDSACEVGSEGCPCTDEDTCDDGLTCESGTCEASAGAVHGSLSFSGQQCGGEFPGFDGSLAEDGADLFGYCHRIGDNLELVVGTKDLEHATYSTDFYLAVTGIVGPPVEGVYDGGGEPKDEESLYTSFESVVFKNVNVFEFELADPDDFSAEELCDIVLYATPIAGEENPYGDDFELYVELDCGGLDVTSNADETIVLMYLEFELWLDGCS